MCIFQHNRVKIMRKISLIFIPFKLSKRQIIQNQSLGFVENHKNFMSYCKE